MKRFDLVEIFLCKTTVVIKHLIINKSYHFIFLINSLKFFFENWVISQLPQLVENWVLQLPNFPKTQFFNIPNCKSAIWSLQKRKIH